MCGIAGRFHPHLLPGDTAWHCRASTLLAHRGPDGQGHYVDEHCELVHRRLALVDLSPSGDQPLCNEDGTVRVVYNGEIYNHRELRADLERRGHRFRGTSDTEVLVHLYEEEGAHLVDRLRGIFAFAIYDRRQRSLLLARDRFGVKPLYWAMHDGQWVFASEMKAITALAGFRPELDRQACYDFLGLGYIPEPATGFTNIRVLPKATVMVVSPCGHRVTDFHRIAARPSLERGLAGAAEATAECLLDAVQRQAMADVPVAALLSGGIDSSLVVAAYSRTSADLPTTFNVRFPDPRYDETALALSASAHLRTSHHTIDLGDYSLRFESLVELLRHFDQPFADMSLVPMYGIARAVRDRGFICTLSGDGGDEVFGGYDRFWRAERLVRLMALPTWCRSAMRQAGGQLAGWTRDWGRQVAKAARLADEGRRNPAVLLAGFSNYLSEEQKRELVWPMADHPLQEVYRHFDGGRDSGAGHLEELSGRLTENLFAVSLPSDMLRKVDMMSMRASIEVRVPLLDEELVALGLTLPHRLKTDGATGKRVLRELARQWLPPTVAAHPKHGFSIPLDVMVSGEFHTSMRELLLSPDARTRSFLNVPLVEQWMQRFEQARHGGQESRRGGAISRGGLYQRVFMVLALEVWMREHDLSW